MSAEVAAVPRVSRSALLLGAALSVGACDKHEEATMQPVGASSVRPTQNSAMPNTQVLPTAERNTQMAGSSLFPQPQIVPPDNPSQPVLEQPTQSTQPGPNAVPTDGAHPSVRPRPEGARAASRASGAHPSVRPRPPSPQEELEQLLVGASGAGRYGAPPFVEWDEV